MPRRSGSLGVCYATSGPGATNLLTGLAGAWQEGARDPVPLTGEVEAPRPVEKSGIEGLRRGTASFARSISVPVVKSMTRSTR